MAERCQALRGRTTLLIATHNLAEIKGPGDVLRPDQRVWADQLRRAGVRAEWWSVRPVR
ncbi:MAG: VRR-NUC domain-containing protein [Deltaproteobacteria bacterium]|nr:VRR-NUC domain-containing protein [Deltaproteobacteria bacterium]